MRVSNTKLKELSKAGNVYKDGKKIQPIQLNKPKEKKETFVKEKPSLNLKKVLSEQKTELIKVVETVVNNLPIPTIEVTPDITIQPSDVNITFPEQKAKRYHVTISRDQYGDIDSMDIEELL